MRRQGAVQAVEPRISIVIGTKDRPESLLRCLQSIARQTSLPLEVLVIDDGHLDPAQAVRALEGTGIAVRYFNKASDRGLTKSRNLGIRESGGDVVLFLDDDVVLDEGYLAAISEVYRERPRVGGVGGRLLSGRLSWPKRLFLRLFLLDGPDEGKVLANGIGVLVRNIGGVKRVDWLSGCNMSFRRGVFEHVMFDESFGGNGWGDDRDFSFRVSRRFEVVATPAAVLHHLEEPSGRQGRFEFGQVEITYMYRFFAKHMPRHVVNLAALSWSFLGITLHNCIALRPGRVLGNIAGVYAVLRHGMPSAGHGAR
jgi:glycosyltransferase involved in cell wall biosynthesis